MDPLSRAGALVLAMFLFAGCALNHASAQSRPPAVEARAAASNALPGIDLLTREAWGAHVPASPMRPHVPRALTIHHTATPQAPDRDPRQTLRALQRFSVSSDTLDNGHPKLPWPDVPYHYYIAPDGTVVEGRDVRYEGDTNTQYDLAGQIQVVVEGDFTQEEPTQAQVESLVRLAGALSDRYGIGPDQVGGHRDRAVGQTSCPGDALEAHFDEVKAAMGGG